MLRKFLAVVDSDSIFAGIREYCESSPGIVDQASGSLVVHWEGNKIFGRPLDERAHIALFPSALDGVAFPITEARLLID